MFVTDIAMCVNIVRFITVKKLALLKRGQAVQHPPLAVWGTFDQVHMLYAHSRFSILLILIF